MLTMMTKQDYIKKRIKSLANRQKLTVTKLAKVVGLNPKSIYWLVDNKELIDWKPEYQERFVKSLKIEDITDILDGWDKIKGDCDD